MIRQLITDGNPGRIKEISPAKDRDGFPQRLVISD